MESFVQIVTLYIAETWTILKANKKKIEALQCTILKKNTENNTIQIKSENKNKRNKIEMENN